MNLLEAFNRHCGKLIRDYEEQKCPALRHTLEIAADAKDRKLANEVIPISDADWDQLLQMRKRCFCEVCGSPATFMTIDRLEKYELGVLVGTEPLMQHWYCEECKQEPEVQRIDLGPW